MFIYNFKQLLMFSSLFLVPAEVVEPECEKSSATTYFWYRQALNITSTIDDTGGLNWRMTLSLLVAWIMVCLAVIKGIQSSGKVCWCRCLHSKGWACKPFRFTRGILSYKVGSIKKRQQILSVIMCLLYFYLVIHLCKWGFYWHAFQAEITC